MSTIGLSPVTVMVSCTVEMPICALTCALKPTVTRMPSLTTRLEAGQLELHRVGADRQARELIGAGFARHRGERLQQIGRREGHGHAGQHAARLIGHLAEDLAGLLLRVRHRRAQEQKRKR